MSELINQVMIWKLAIVRLGINCLIVGATAYTTTMSGIRWSDLDGDQKFMVLLGITVIVGSNVQAFLDKTITRISEGKGLVETGTTAYFKKQP